MGWVGFWKWLHKALLPGKVIELGSGYDKLHQQRKQLKRLRDACIEVVSGKAYLSRDVTGDGKPETFCNKAVQYVAEAMGCGLFMGDLLANQMHELMNSHTEFDSVSGQDAVRLANKGCLVIASRKAQGHGHVSVVFPGPMEFSASLQKDVPLVAHVGKPPNGIKRMSLAFNVGDGVEPEYFWWRPSEA